MGLTLDWLCESEPWVEYRTRVELMGQPETHLLVQAARQRMVDHPRIKGLITELQSWPGQKVSSHKKADLFMHKLVFLADLGITVSDQGMDTVVSRILAHQSKEGPFQVMMNIPPSIGGSGKDELAWALCDSPLIVYALIKMGLDTHPQVQHAFEAMLHFVQPNGWPCVVSPEMGKFHGPGRKGEPCPYATLIMLKLHTVLPGYSESEPAVIAGKSLLRAWRDRQSYHPFIFYMGTDFCKLKAPFVWYDILHVSDVLSRLPMFRKEPEYIEMMDVIRQKSDDQGKYTPESIWLAWKEWDFGQKKMPSAWLTFLATRILQRMDGN